MLYYTYIVRNKENGKKYIGYRQALDPHNDIYFGSPASKFCENNIEYQNIIKNHPYMLQKRVLRIFKTAKDALNHEIELHNRYNVGVNKDFYNAGIQTANGFSFTGRKHSDKSCIKMSVTRKASGIKPPNTKTWWTKEHAEKASKRMIGNSFKLGIKESNDTKENKRIAFAKSKTHAVHLKTKTEAQLEASRINGKKTMTDNNPMNNKISRDKISKKKIGTRKLVKDGKMKLALPGSDKWINLIEEGYTP